jgi:uridine phosphorylase
VPRRLKPTAAIAPRAVLVGDPGRALMLAQELLEAPKMCNHARGLWGYTGERGGAQLTVQSTGMGGPSAAVVLRDLAELGVRRAVRIGTCAAISPDLAAGDAVLVERAVEAAAESGVPAAELPDERLNRELAAALAGRARPAAAASLAFLHRPGDTAPVPGAAVADMQTAALLRAAEAEGVAAAALLVVAETAAGGDLDAEALAAAVRSLGTLAADVL